jgi:hypothetical protein
MDGFNNLKPRYNQDMLGKDGGKHYLATATRFAQVFTKNAFSILCGIDPFPESVNGKEYFDIAWENRYSILRLARKFKILEEVFGSIEGNLTCLMFTFLLDALFSECQETVEVNLGKNNIRQVLNSRQVMFAIQRCVAKRNELAMIINNLIITHNR